MQPRTAAAAAMAGEARCVRAPGPLPALEVAVGGRDRTLPARDGLVVGCEAHGAAGLAPLEAGIFEDLIEPLRLGGALDLLRPRNGPGAHIGRNVAPLEHGGGGAQVGEAAIGAR